MTIYLKKFGSMLISRPAGREAWLSAQAYVLPKSNDEEIVLDFDGVDVLTPSWADEFITNLRERQGEDKIEFVNIDNPSVKVTLGLLFGYET